MKQSFTAINSTHEGKPNGGEVHGLGLTIQWQKGPLVNPGSDPQANGCFVETVLEAALQRLEYFQTLEFRCRENALAITKLEEALLWLGARADRRVRQGTAGTHISDPVTVAKATP